MTIIERIFLAKQTMVEIETTKNDSIKINKKISMIMPSAVSALMGICALLPFVNLSFSRYLIMIATFYIAGFLTCQTMTFLEKRQAAKAIKKQMKIINEANNEMSLIRNSKIEKELEMNGIQNLFKR